MVTKEQRRGMRFDLEKLRAFVKEKMFESGEMTTKGAVAVRFNWSHAKLYTMFKTCDEAYEDIAIVSGCLIYTGGKNDL